MANEMRLIDIAQCEKYGHACLMYTEEDGSLVQTFTSAFPTIDPETLRPKGHWNIRCYRTYDSYTGETDEDFYLECSECKREVWNIDQSVAIGGEYRKLIEQYPYCHCGCKMEG